MSIRANVCVKDCISCNACSSVCPTEAIKVRPEGFSFSDKKCIACFACTVVCPTQCIKVEDIQEWYKNVKKNKVESVYDFDNDIEK